MKSQDSLLVSVLHDVGRICGIAPERDIKYALSRSEYEGDSFYTITLPSFARALERSLDEGRLCSDEFLGFGQDSRGLPLFMGGFLRRIFTNTGVVYPTSPQLVEAIWAIRQVCGLQGKLRILCSDARIERALLRFQSVDAEVPMQGDFPPSALAEFVETFSKLFGHSLDNISRRLMAHEPLPFKHGPGAVQDRTSSNGKYLSNVWTDRLEAVLPAQENLAVSLHDFIDQEFIYLQPSEEPPVRVIPVPKTMKTPRLIAIEPVWTQYVQQALLALLTTELSSTHLWHSAMSWEDQERNRLLSRNTDFCTVDLSDASDSVSSYLVRCALDNFPIFRDIVFACRSQEASLPDGTLVQLRKFASMGSAMCFPIETMVFTTLCQMAVNRYAYDSATSSGGAFTPLMRGVFSVYGDDMIVHVDVMPYLLVLLQTFGLKVNTKKTFGKGLFRESCGYDSYDGLCVNITRVSHSLDTIKRHSVEALGLFSLHNSLLESGLEKCASIVRTKLHRLGLGVYAPWGSLALAMWTNDPLKVKVRTNPFLHKLEVKAVVPSFTYPKDPLDHYGALRKYFLHSNVGFNPRPMAAYHLERAGRPQCVNNHIGWVDPAMDLRD